MKRLKWLSIFIIILLIPATAMGIIGRGILDGVNWASPGAIGNTTPAAGTFTSVVSGAITVTTAGPTDNLDVSAANTVYINTGSNNVTIGGFTGGVSGQRLFVSVINSSNNAVLEHAESTGNQDIYLSDASDETITAGYGGWVLVCNGTHWYEGTVGSPAGGSGDVTGITAGDGIRVANGDTATPDIHVDFDENTTNLEGTGLATTDVLLYMDSSNSDDMARGLVSDLPLDLVDDTTPQLADDLDGQGNYLVNVQNIPDLASKGPAYWFDGVDDVITVGDDSDIDVGIDDFYIEICITPYDITRTTDYLINKEAAGIGYGLYINEDDLYIRLDDDTTDVSAIIGTAVFADYVKANILVTFDRSGNATAYINGKLAGTVAISTANLTLSNAGDLHIGQDSAGGNEFLGDIWKHRIGNLVLSATEVKAFSSGAPVPYKYIGVSQTALINDFPASHDFLAVSPQDGWTLYGTPTTCSTDGDSKLTVVLDENYEGVYIKPITIVGKLYRLTFDATVTDLTSDEKLQIYCVHLTLISGTADITANGTYSCIYRASAAAPTIYMRGVNYSDSISFTIDNPSFTQIGCVLQLEQDGITDTTWFDKSGNGLDGTVSGAIATNKNVNLVADTYGSDGSVTDAEFLRINTLSSNAQDQITANEGELNNEAGLYAALSDVSDFVQPDEKFTMGATIQETVNADATPDVSNAATGVNNIYESNANGTITDFDDTDDHSEFSDGDFFIFVVTDASTVIDFSENANIEGNAVSENANIEGNAGVDFTGSATQIVYILFVYESARWNAVNLTGGYSTPTTLALSSIDMGGGDLEIPNSDDPDVDTTGQISLDTDGWLRVYQNSLQKGLPVDENISITILQPDDAEATDDIPIWCNFSGMSFEIHTIYAMSDVDDATFTLVSCPYTDLTDETTIEAITVSTNSTGVFTYTIGAGAGTDIDEGTVPTGECIVFDPSADDLGFVTVTILGYYVGDVD